VETNFVVNHGLLSFRFRDFFQSLFHALILSRFGIKCKN
jgi:hypothetical protein